MNPILDAFLAGVINGITQTLWVLIALIVLLFVLSLLQRDDDDDDDGTYQPVYVRKNDE